MFQKGPKKVVLILLSENMQFERISKNGTYVLYPDLGSTTPKANHIMTRFKIPGTFPGQIGCYENVRQFT